MFPSLRRVRFPLTLAFGLIISQLLLALLIQSQAKPDRVWLGDYVWNTSDQAVYLNYIEQAKRGAIFFKSFYAPAEAGTFLHPTYVPIGWIARVFDLTATQAHEVSRWIVTLISVFLFYAVAKDLTNTERDARIATVTMMIGGGIGWILVVHQSMQGFFPHGFFVPDVSSETFFFPTMLGGAHIPLSMALLVYGLHRTGKDLSAIKNKDRTQLSWQMILSTNLLFFIHPYFVPILGVYGLLMMAFLQLSARDLLRIILTYLPFTIASIGPHIWSHFSNPYRRFLLEGNQLKLASPIANLFSVLPWLGFILWRFRKESLQEREKWIVLWLIAVVLVIALPFIHFKRKMLEGVGAGVMLLALPIWLRVLAWAKRTGWIAHAGMWTMIVLSPLSIVQSQIAWVMDPHLSRGDEFFVSTDFPQMWNWLSRETFEDTMILPDEPWVGLWISAKALRRTWIAHDYETPHWSERRAFLNRLFQTSSSKRVQEMLKETQADFIVTTTMERGAFIDTHKGEDWKEVKRFNEIRIWGK